MAQRLPDADIANRYKTLYHCSLFGYQYNEDKGTFYMCYCSDDLTGAQIEQIKQISSVDTLNYGDWINHGYMEVHWTEHDKISQLFNTMLMLGHSFTTRNIASVNFSPNDGDGQFTDALMEHKCVSTLTERLDQFPRGIYMPTLFTNNHFKIWNYSTDEGRLFCHRIRSLKGKKEANWNSPNNYLLLPAFREPPQVHAREPEPPERWVVEPPIVELPLPVHQPDDDIDDGLCMVCMDNVPNTQVHPCGHIVVCFGCSEQLKNTSDVHTCVKCRRTIEGEPVTL